MSTTRTTGGFQFLEVSTSRRGTLYRDLGAQLVILVGVARGRAPRFAAAEEHAVIEIFLGEIGTLARGHRIELGRRRRTSATMLG